MEYLLLPVLGLIAGVVGTLVGAGGGFLIVPALLFLYPDQSPVVTTSISLCVALLNGLSGTVAYTRQRRIDFRSGVMFSLAAIPGSVVGAIAVRYISRDAFNVGFGLLLGAVSIYLAVRRPPAPRAVQALRGYLTRTMTDRTGKSFTWSYRPQIGIGFSLLVGLISSLAGIGGGIILVPIMVILLSFPPHIAAATSTFVLVATTLSGTVTHVLAGDLSGVWDQALLLGVGVIVGAQFGAALSRRVPPVVITRVLSGALFLVAVRLLWRALS